MYKIKINYSTGDSFHTEEREEFLEYEFEKLETAKENLERIKEHYEVYQEYGRNYHGSYKEIKEKYGNKKWFVSKDSKIYDTFLSLHSLNLVLDDKREVRYSSFWTGYFERLHGAYIEQELPSFET